MKMRTLILLALSLVTINAHAVVILGVEGRVKGQVIAVRTDEQIIASCDFSKQIVRFNFNILCVYNGVAPEVASNKSNKQQG